MSNRKQDGADPPAVDAPSGGLSPRPEGAREVLSRSFTSQGGVVVVDARFPPGEYRPPSWGHLLTLRRSGPRRRVWREDGQTLEGTAGTDTAGVVPAGQPFTFEVQETIETLSVVLRESFVERIAEQAGVDFERVEVVSSLYVPDPPLARLMRSFLPEIGGANLGGELYAEALAAQLAVYLLRHHSSLGRRDAIQVARGPAGPVSKRAISQAQDYVNDNLAGGLSIEDLAEAAGYSPHHFARLFKEATGVSPHRYVVGRRVEMAVGLLEGTELPLVEVARMCGFSSQSHMGKNVKALTGVTPARLRREARR